MEDFKKLSKEKLVEELEALNRVYEEVMGGMTEIRAELLERLGREKVDGCLVGEYSIKKAKRVTFKTTLEEAEPLGAVKKAPDTDILRKLYNKGIKVPGATETIYLSVRRLEQHEQEEQSKI